GNCCPRRGFAEMRIASMLEPRPVRATAGVARAVTKNGCRTDAGYARNMPLEPTNTEAIRVISRFEASNGIPDSMRADVRMLGGLLGQVLRESGTPGLFEDVERLRLATIQAAEADGDEAFQRAASIADSFTIERADEVARAFTCYFHLVNLAEEHQRVRVLRERAGKPAREGSTDTVATAFAQLSREVGDEQARERLAELRFHPVFTAHPTEARRRAVSGSIRRLSELLTQNDAASVGGAEQN